MFQVEDDDDWLIHLKGVRGPRLMSCRDTLVELFLSKTCRDRLSI